MVLGGPHRMLNSGCPHATQVFYLLSLFPISPFWDDNCEGSEVAFWVHAGNSAQLSWGRVIMYAHMHYLPLTMYMMHCIKNKKEMSFFSLHHLYIGGICVISRWWTGKCQLTNLPTCKACPLAIWAISPALNKYLMKSSLEPNTVLCARESWNNSQVGISSSG